MQKQYRKIANILAEQFDGSKEMMGKVGYYRNNLEWWYSDL